MREDNGHPNEIPGLDLNRLLTEENGDDDEDDEEEEEEEKPVWVEVRQGGADGPRMSRPLVSYP
jgi:hypothetical protein